MLQEIYPDAPPFVVNYDATDAQLRAAGIDARTLTLSKQPFLRPGGIDFDVPYALAVWNACDKVSLMALRLNNPTVPHVYFPPHAPYMGHILGD